MMDWIQGERFIDLANNVNIFYMGYRINNLHIHSKNLHLYTSK